jgi:hypothetical protein
MSFYADCYILVASRSPTLAKRLCEIFAPGGVEESAVNYHIPQFCNTPHVVFTEASQLMEYLAEHPHEKQSIYWRTKNPSNALHVNVFYTNDGAMILGVACPHSTREEEILDSLKNEFSTTCGYITYECPPPDSTCEFMALVKSFDEQNASS